MSGQQWGRVDTDGTVWVRTADGERAVGQYPGATEADALAYFSRKFEDLQAQVTLLEQRIAAGHVSGADAAGQLRKLTEAVRDANAVGDLAGLLARIEGLNPLVEQRRAEAERARQEARAKAAAERTTIVEEAEALTSVDPERLPWKTTGDRLRVLFEEWRRLQKESRLDKHTEDELWKRFSHARTGFDRKRRQHFGALDDQHAAARTAKEQLAARAEALATSTDWGSTAAAYRDLMAAWKTAGRAARKDDDALWARFRAAQDAFFAARTGAAAQTAAQIDTEFADNLRVKEQLITEAEALLPVTDVGAARSALRDLQERWEAAGKVPRADLTRLEARMRAIETAVRETEQERWTRSNPQARARAQDAVDQLEATIAQLRERLDRARAAGDTAAVGEHEQSLAARQEWLAQARRALADFGG